MENDPRVLRRLAQVSLLFALASLLATAVALVLLPNAATLGQWIVVGAGGFLGLAAFALGVMISLRKPFARRLGFVVVVLACLAAVLFGLLAIAVPDSATAFSAPGWRSFWPMSPLPAIAWCAGRPACWRTSPG